MKINYKNGFLFAVSFWFITNLQAQFYTGVDLSYVNEMEDCGVVFKENNADKDPYQLFAEHGSNLVRVRLWHDPHWTNYSNLEDVKETLERAKASGQATLLDFHYSDEWTDPAEQKIPAAWEKHVNNTNKLTNLMYDYTYDVLSELNGLGLMPDMVQVGNETNGNMLRDESMEEYPVNWNRNSELLNAGINAVRDISTATGKQVKIILHIADPVNGDWWFRDAVANGVTDFDIIGLSYYPVWHTSTIAEAVDIMSSLKEDLGKDVMVVETGYPWTQDYNDNASNMMNDPIAGYENISPATQAQWLIDFTQAFADAGGLGVLYWEPAWVSSPCSTLWGQGSHWENITFFDFNNNLLNDGGIKFLEEDYGTGVNTVFVTFRVDMTGSGATEAYLTGQFPGESTWSFKEMAHETGSIYVYTMEMTPGDAGAFVFYTQPAFNTDYREEVPSGCAEYWGDHRGYLVQDEFSTQHYSFEWASCTWIPEENYRALVTKQTDKKIAEFKLYPNPATHLLHLDGEDLQRVVIFNMLGEQVLDQSFDVYNVAASHEIDVAGLKNGIYSIKVYAKGVVQQQAFIKQ